MAKECTVTFSFIGSVPNSTVAVALVSGVNTIEDELWKQVVERPYAQNLLEYGALKVLGEAEPDPRLDPPPETGVDAIVPPVAITKMKVADAIDIIDATFDPAILQAWADKETRTPVRGALERRFNEITMGQG
jgi:hypothetical protein